MVRLFVHGDTIYPDVIRVRPGKVFIRAENATLEDISVVVERVQPGQGRRVEARVKTVSRARRADQEITVGTGEYELFEETQPAYRCKMIVEPK